MNYIKTIFLVSICLCLYSSRVSSKCVMRGTCAVIGGNEKLCPVDHEALPILKDLPADEKAEVLSIVKSKCPNLMYDQEGNLLPDDEIVSCCEGQQLKSMAGHMSMAESVLGRCPICIKNFLRQICEMNCSPDQARFVTVSSEVAPDNTLYVNEINYRVFNDFMINAHLSCAGVLVPQSGMPAINLMCGNAPVCDADAWFGFTGDTSQNPIAPVQVNFHRVFTREDSMNVVAPLCHETLEGDIPCSCVDCTVNCPNITPDVPDICEVGNLNCIGFSVGISVFVITVTMFIILTLIQYKKERSQSYKDKHEAIKYKYKVNIVTRIFQKCFINIAEFSSSNPILIIMITTWVTFGMLFGALDITVTSKPIDLWSGPQSRSRQEFNYFNSRFGPFYRAAQVFLKIKDLEPFVVGNTTYGPAFRIEALEELVKLENAITNIGRNSSRTTIEEVCYAPLRLPGTEQRVDQCVFMSASYYLPDRNNINKDRYLDNIRSCLNNYLSLSCLLSWGGGADPEISLGGYVDNILEADTLITNYPIANHLQEEDLEPTLQWEKDFLDLMHDYQENWKADFVDVSFGAERSLEDELTRVSKAEIIPMSISYILMFIYVILALGNIRNVKTLFIDCKVSVAISCIIIVLLAILCAVGVLGYINMPISLLAINVIPFFVLSVGIDNVFLMVNELSTIQSTLTKFEDYKENFSSSQKKRFIFGKMMMNVGPSILVSSITQVSCFAIGTLSVLPAVKTFAMLATFSLAFLFLFQITTVISILSIDYSRYSKNRFDIFCCIQKKILNDEDPLQDNIPYEGLTQKLMKPYANFILDWRSKIVVAIFFMTILSLSIIVLPNLEIGLDQEMAFPPDSYVYKYLRSVNEILVIGPPVYFVLKGGLNFTNHDHQNMVCGGQLCNVESVPTQLFLASRISESSYIARTSNSWLDDFLEWTSLPGSCCKYNSTDGGFCSSSDNSPECKDCSIGKSEVGSGLRPEEGAFGKYIPSFLRDAPTETCNKGGLASYFSNINYLLDSEGRATVYDSNFMTYHTTLVTSKDYISAIDSAYKISANITSSIRRHTGLDVEVFPYSVFYVFYEQYLTMWRDSILTICYSVIGVLVINILVTGFNFIITGSLILIVIMVIVDMMGIMYIWNIQLNAVSTINLVMAVAITVEFCAHIAHAYTTSESHPREKIKDAIKKVGATVITGITLTNIPIIVLAFSYTDIIEVFFFRMLFSLVILGFLHGMVFFPVLLSFIDDIKLRFQ